MEFGTEPKKESISCASVEIGSVKQKTVDITDELENLNEKVDEHCTMIESISNKIYDIQMSIKMMWVMFFVIIFFGIGIAINVIYLLQ